MAAENNRSSKGVANEASELEKIMTWEEYYTDYVAKQKMLYERHRRETLNAHGDMSETHDLSTSRNENNNNYYYNNSFNHEQEAQQQEQEEQQQPAEAQFNLFGFIVQHQSIIAYLADLLLRVIIATLLFFRTVTAYYVFLTLVAYAVWILLSFVFNSIRVERERANNAPGATRSVRSAARQRRGGFALRRVINIITRCITSFFLSLSPTYSVEQLEMELEEDDAAAAHPHQD